MEAAKPIQIETPMPNIDNTKIDFKEELLIKNDKDKYKIQFGTKENDLVIKVISENSKEFFYYQQFYSMNELKNLSIIFSMYQSIEDIIKFLKKLKFGINEKNDELLLKFNIFMPDGQNKLIELNLTQYLSNTIYIIKYLLKEIHSIKIDKIKNESEIQKLKTNNSNHEIEINNLKEIISKTNKEISNLREENIKLKNEINILRQYHEKSKEIEKANDFFFDSKIIKSRSSIDFILNYIRNNDTSLNFKGPKLLYRGSRDGDKTKTCHKLCDNKQNVLIIMQTDNNYIFGGYSKIGFKAINDINKWEWKKDNTLHQLKSYGNCFLFSINLKKIYPVIKDEEIICHISDKSGLCFDSSLSFGDNFMHTNNSINSFITNMFNGFENEYEINGGKVSFILSELEVFQLL